MSAVSLDDDPALRDGAHRLLLDAAHALADGAGPAALATLGGDALARLARLEVYTCHLLAADGSGYELVASGGLDVARLGELERLPADADGAHAAVGSRLGTAVHECYPLPGTAHPLGLLCFGGAGPDPLTPAVTGTVRALADLVGIAARCARDARERALDERRKQDFLATLAHELRNPLAPLRQAVRLALARDAVCADPRLEWSLRVIDRHTGHMGRLLDQLLDVARLQRGRLQLHREAVTLQAVVDAALDAARPLIDERGHRLAVAVRDGDAPLAADLVRLAGALTNLLANAARFTQPGGSIAIDAEADGGEARIVVRDSGVGIPADRLPYLFEGFAHDTPVLQRTQGGLGVGLAIARGIVELHGGSVAARSAGRGTGSEFVVRVPLQEAPAAPSAAVAGAADPRARRVIVADDNHDTAQSLSMLLSLAGWEVRTAHDGCEALEMAAGFRPSAAVLDIGMPRLNGYEVAARIRAQPWGRGVKLLAVTGWGQDEDRRRASEVGFDHHLTKPVDPDRIEELLATPRRPGAP